MRSVLIGGILSVALLGGGATLVRKPESGAVDRDIVVASLTRGEAQANARETFLASNGETGDICLIERVSGEGGTPDRLQPASDCDAVWPGLGGAGYWREDDRGHVAITASGGAPVLTVAAGDGLDFETVDPLNALITLSSLE